MASVYYDISEVSISPKNLSTGQSFVLTVKTKTVDKLRKIYTVFYNYLKTEDNPYMLRFKKTTTKSTGTKDGKTYRFICNNISYSTTNRKEGTIYFIKD